VCLGGAAVVACSGPFHLSLVGAPVPVPEVGGALVGQTGPQVGFLGLVVGLEATALSEVGVRVGQGPNDRGSRPGRAVPDAYSAGSSTSTGADVMRSQAPQT
jgi:hypothetical protein